MEKRPLTLINKLGLHARASMKLVDLASGFASDIKLHYNNTTVDAKSIMNMMVMGATFGTTIEVVIEGEDEAEAMTAIAQLINDRFGESE